MDGCLAGGLATRNIQALTGILVESYGRVGVVGQVRLIWRAAKTDDAPPR